MPVRHTAPMLLFAAGLLACAEQAPAPEAPEERRSSAFRAGAGDFDATGTLPCAQAEGQPTAPCAFGVTREGAGDATVVVERPDGIARALFFVDGVFFNADTSRADGYPDYGATRQGDLFVVRVGEERYEVPEAVVFGG